MREVKNHTYYILSIIPKKNFEANANRVLVIASNSAGKTQEKWLGVDENHILFSGDNTPDTPHNLKDLTGDDLLHISIHYKTGWIPESEIGKI